ncbi:unnamed protein product [Coregonus sp. 'balchen']|nr:unnamed protein product [Coregonus sp. 'balchen']
MLLLLCVCDRAEGVIRRHCDCYEEDMYVQKDIGGVLDCSFKPGLGPYAECTEITDLRFLHLLVSTTWGGVNVTLEPGVFQGLSSLEELTLAGMSLALAPPALLDSLVGVRRLRVGRAGVRDLGELVCLLSPGMDKLETLELPNSKVSSIQNRGCSGSNPWPTALLSRIRILDRSGNPVRRVEPKSLAVFQNLSSLSLSMVDVWVGQLWGSGMGRVNKLYLSSYAPRQFTPSLSDLCTLVLSVNSEDLSGMELGFWTGTGQLQGLMMVLTKLTNASFCSAGGGRVWNLTSLILHDNHLTEITTDQFSCMPLLEHLDLSRNHIYLLAHRALQGMPLLRVLDLTHNKISLLGEDDFEGLPALEVRSGYFYYVDVLSAIGLEGKQIIMGTRSRGASLMGCSVDSIDSKTSAWELYELILNMLFLGFPTKLQHLLIDTGPGTYLTVGHVPAPEVPMVLELREKLIQSSDCVNNMFPMVRELKVGQDDDLLCTVSQFWHPLHNQLRKLKRLKLTNLNFSNHTDPSVTFRNLTELRSLVLINCRLNFLTRVDFCCDCSNGWLLDWANNSRKTQHSHRLILIFLEHISPFELSAFHRLAKLARTRTYLDWPQDEDERVTFWERFRRNIAERDTDELVREGVRSDIAPFLLLFS